MKLIRRVNEPEVIAEFLKNEFHQDEFNDDRAQFEKLVLDADVSNSQENALRRALLFRRRGHMWRELPSDTQWWRVEFEPEDLQLIRVFPRAQWRRVSNGSFQLTAIADRIRSNHFNGTNRDFIAKVHALSYRMRTERDTSSVLLIGIDEVKPLTILEGNHRLTAALLAGAEQLRSNFRVLCGFSPNMGESCWYETNFANLWHYMQNRFRTFFYDKEADVKRVMNARPMATNSDGALHPGVSARKAFPGSE